MLSSIYEWRVNSKLHSLLDENYAKKSSLTDKWAKVSCIVALDWWRENHQRSSVQVGIHGLDKVETDNDRHTHRDSVIKKDKPFQEIDGKYTIQPDHGGSPYWKENSILMPSMWYNSIYKHGLSKVVYKSRPCMVIDIKPRPIQRLKSKDIDVYKADVVSCKNGIIELIRDLYLVSYQTKKWQRNPEGRQYSNINSSERVFQPHKYDIIGECHLACNENLRIAENTINGRLMSGITKALDI